MKPVKEPKLKPTGMDVEQIKKIPPLLPEKKTVMWVIGGW